MKTYILIFISLCVLTSCNDRSTGTPSAGAATDSAGTAETVSFSVAQQQSAGIETGTPGIERMGGVLTLQGQIDVPPQSMVSLGFPLGGYLKSTDLLPGMHVRKGQTLAVMEDMQYIQLQQDYLMAREQYNLALAEYERQATLNASKASSDKVLQQAGTQKETQRILLSALTQKLALIGIDPARLSADNLSKSVNITSPIDGYVSTVNVNVGKYTAPTDMLFELIDPRDIHLVLQVFEKDLHQLSVGQTVTAYTNHAPGKKYAAEILLVGKSLNNERVAEVHCHFKQYDAALVPGMFMNAEVTVNSQTTLTVPEDAVVHWENKAYVFVDQGNHTFHMTEVAPGVTHHGKQQITGGDLTADTRLVVKAAYALLMKIKNTEEE